MNPSPLVQELVNIVGEQAVLWRPEDLMLYEYDALSSLRQPDAVAFPTCTEEVVGVVKLAAGNGIPVVARGAGTGHTGAALMATPDVTVIALIQYFHTCKFADAFSHHLPQGHEN